MAVLLRWDREASRGGVGSDWVRETGREGIQYVLDREVSDGQADALAEMLRRSALDHTFTEQARRYTSASTQGDGEREQQQQDEQQLLRLALEASTRLQSRSEPDLDFALALRRSLLDAHPASNRNEDDPAFLRALHDSELESHGNGGAGGTSTTHSGLSIAAMGARARQLALERGEDADTSAIESQVRGRGFRGHGSRSGGEETIASTTVPSISTATSMATSTATPEATPESQTAEGSRNTTNVTSQRGKRRKRKSRRRDNEQRPAPTSSSVDVDAYDEVPKDEPPGYTMVADPGRGEKVRFLYISPTSPSPSSPSPPKFSKSSKKTKKTIINNNPLLKQKENR